MKYQDKTVLTKVKLRATRKIAEIQTSLIPELMEDMSAEALSSRLGARIDSYSPEEQKRMWFRTAVAVADLRELKEDLAEHRDAVVEELRRLKGYRAATNAYQRSQRAIQKTGTR